MPIPTLPKRLGPKFSSHFPISPKMFCRFHRVFLKNVLKHCKKDANNCGLAFPPVENINLNLGTNLILLTLKISSKLTKKIPELDPKIQ